MGFNKRNQKKNRKKLNKRNPIVKNKKKNNGFYSIEKFKSVVRQKLGNEYLKVIEGFGKSKLKRLVENINYQIGLWNTSKELTIKHNPHVDKNTLIKQLSPVWISDSIKKHKNKHPNDSMIGVYVGMKCMESPISELVEEFMESPLRKIVREMNQYEMVS